MNTSSLQAAAMRVTRQRRSAPVLGFEPLPWMVDAACLEYTPETWFPEKGASTRDAKRVCADCPVKAECLAFALENGERFGVWGGLSERERRRLPKDRHARPWAKRTLQPCGTPAAYRRHFRRGEPACDACVRAQALARAERADRAAS